MRRYNGYKTCSVLIRRLLTIYGCSKLKSETDMWDFIA